MIKNAITYSVELPSTVEAAIDLICNENTIMTRKPGDGEKSTFGLAIHASAGGVVNAFDGGYHMSFRYWDKPIKAKIINERMKERSQGQTLNKLQKQELRDEIINELIAIIPAESNDVDVYYHIASKTLIVDTNSQKMADMVTACLRRIIGSLKATTLYIDMNSGLTNRVRDRLASRINNIFFNNVCFGNSISLEGYTGEKITYANLLDDDGAVEDLVDWLDASRFSVDKLDLSIEDIMSCTLDSKFKLSKINFDFGDGYNDDDLWSEYTAFTVDMVAKLTSDLVKEFQVVKSTDEEE